MPEPRYYDTFMGLKTAVAFAGNEGYDLYWSADGASGYGLRPILQQYVNGELTQQELLDLSRVPEEWDGGDISKGELVYDPEGSLETNRLFEADEPFATDVPADELMSLRTLPVYETEVLYIVEWASVEVIAPVLPDPAALLWLARGADIHLYHPERPVREAHELMQAGEEPDRRLVGVAADADPASPESRLTPETLDTAPEWVAQTLRQGHRYVLHRCWQLAHQQSVDRESLPLSLPTGHLQVWALTSEWPSKQFAGIPVRIPWIAGAPKYPLFYDRNRIGPAPKVRASNIRTHLFSALYETLRVTENVNAAIEDLVRECLVRLGDTHAPDLAMDYWPGDMPTPAELRDT